MAMAELNTGKKSVDTVWDGAGNNGLRKSRITPKTRITATVNSMGMVEGKGTMHSSLVRLYITI
ncbi:hypothetical protein F4604DRAFT_1955880 [Suillus subluteus]|nr:hypothetical protein F4604DRAFT_1955880 [Suillus subluteus]